MGLTTPGHVHLLPFLPQQVPGQLHACSCWRARHTCGMSVGDAKTMHLDCTVHAPLAAQFPCHLARQQHALVKQAKICAYRMCWATQRQWPFYRNAAARPCMSHCITPFLPSAPPCERVLLASTWRMQAPCCDPAVPQALCSAPDEHMIAIKQMHGCMCFSLNTYACSFVEQPMNSAQADHLGVGVALDMRFPIKVGQVMHAQRPPKTASRADAGRLQAHVQA